MRKIFEKIQDIDECRKLLIGCINNLFLNGSVDTTQLEILTNIRISQPDLFAKYENQILVKMGLFYKPLQIHTFEDSIFKIYREYIKEKYNGNLTPVKSNII